MIAVTFANILAIIILLIGKFFRTDKKAFILAISFLIIFFGIRENYGNDYPAYLEIFKYFSNDSIAEAIKSDIRYEYGWRILNVLFAPLGFQTLIFGCTALQFIGIGWFINKYCPEKYRWVIFAIYLFSSQLMLTELSMLRQSLAMTICLFSVPFILKKDFIRAALIIILAAQFHSTAYSALLLLIIPLIKNCSTIILIIIFLSLYFAFQLIETLASDLLLYIFTNTDYGEIYGNYLEKGIGGTQGSGIGSILRLLTGIYYLIITGNDSKRQYHRFFALSYCFMVLLLPLSLTALMIARILSYFEKISLISYYYLLDNTRSKYALVGKLLFFLNIAFILIRYFAFFDDPTYTDAFSTYHTIID